jgi:hypothetical protein
MRFARRIMRRAAAARPALEALAAVCIGVAAAAAYAGPLRFEMGEIDLSVRSLGRPLLAAAALLAVRFAVPDRARDRLHDGAGAAVRVCVGAVIAAALAGWMAYQSPTVGGADSYGYVSAAERIARGTLIEDEPLARILPFDDATRAAVPLGYVPSAARPHASAPAYPLGLPALMAAAIVAGGRDAAFMVAPVLGLALVAAAALVARAWYGDMLTALVAAALLAIHPLVFTYAIQPMSDVPAAACILLAVAALTRGRFALCGCSAAAALMIRPALAPASASLAIVPLLLQRRAGVQAAVAVAAPVAIAAFIEAGVHAHLYGAVFASGYGAVGDLFAVERLAANLRSYTYWAVTSMGLPAMASIALGLAASGRDARVTTALVTMAAVAPHLLYRTYDHWETLRFLLPAIALLTIVCARGIVTTARWLPGALAGPLAAVVVTIAIAWSWVGWMEASGVFLMPEHERRHRLAAEMVERTTPADAVVLALQHSGSLRYYAHRDTLNWDQIPDGSLRETVRVLRDHGRPVFVITDSEAERARFREKHGLVLEEDGWLPAGQRRDVQLYEAPRR